LNADSSPALTERLVGYLRPGAPGLMLTSGADGYPASAYTWVVVMDARCLRFAVDCGSSALENLRRSGQASLQIIGPGDISFLIKGKARQIRQQIEAAAPAAVMLWELDVMAVKDQSWAGVTTTALQYQWPAAQREAMHKMEQAVYAEMRDFAA